MQYLWRFQRFSHFDLATTEGEPLQVIKPGIHNRDAGPDFLDARIRIGDTVWAGNVEIHTEASLWFAHKHHQDRAYDNVVLHVVYTPDAEVHNGSGDPIPVLCLKDLFDYQMWRNYQAWSKSGAFIPCEKLVAQVPSHIKAATVEVNTVERLEDKSSICLDHLTETRGDLETAFYRLLMRSFGMKVNALPFEQLARCTPLDLVRRYWGDPVDLEALFLGQAGFLKEEPATPYVKMLSEKFRFMVAKHRLEPMANASWKLFRLRPPNFPQVRLAQLAAFYHQWQAVARRIADHPSYDKVRPLFDVVPAHDFWLTHYTLSKESPKVRKQIGDGAAQLLLINAVVPYLFALGNYNKDLEIKEKAMAILDEMPAEKNRIVHGFAQLGFNVRQAFDSQGLLQLKKFGCDQRKCLTCKTGIFILNQHATTDTIHP